MLKFAKGNNSKIKHFYFYFHHIRKLLIIFSQLTKFETPSFNSFQNILITKFHSAQRETRGPEGPETLTWSP